MAKFVLTSINWEKVSLRLHENCWNVSIFVVSLQQNLERVTTFYATPTEKTPRFPGEESESIVKKVNEAEEGSVRKTAADRKQRLKTKCIMAIRQIQFPIVYKQNTNSESAGYGHYYPYAWKPETLELRGLIERVAMDQSVYSRDIVEGVI